MAPVLLSLAAPELAPELLSLVSSTAELRKPPPGPPQPLPFRLPRPVLLSLPEVRGWEASS